MYIDTLLIYILYSAHSGLGWIWQWYEYILKGYIEYRFWQYVLKWLYVCCIYAAIFQFRRSMGSPCRDHATMIDIWHRSGRGFAWHHFSNIFQIYLYNTAGIFGSHRGLFLAIVPTKIYEVSLCVMHNWKVLPSDTQSWLVAVVTWI